MIDLTVKDLVKSFEVGTNILDGVSFEVNTGERIGILGRNGCGKTTLFRLLSGALYPDSGEISIASGRRLGLISQIPVYPEGYTTEDVLREAHRRLYDLEDRMNHLAERMASTTPRSCWRNTTGSARIFAVSAATTWSTSGTEWQTVSTSTPPCAPRALTPSPAARRPA